MAEQTNMWEPNLIFSILKCFVWARVCLQKCTVLYAILPACLIWYSVCKREIKTETHLSAGNCVIACDIKLCQPIECVAPAAGVKCVNVSVSGTEIGSFPRPLRRHIFHLLFNETLTQTWLIFHVIFSVKVTLCVCVCVVSSFHPLCYMCHPP